MMGLADRPGTAVLPKCSKPHDQRRIEYCPQPFGLFIEQCRPARIIFDDLDLIHILGSLSPNVQAQPRNQKALRGISNCCFARSGMTTPLATAYPISRNTASTALRSSAVSAACGATGSPTSYPWIARPALMQAARL